MRASIEKLLAWFVPVSILASIFAGFAIFILHDHETLSSVAKILSVDPLQLVLDLKIMEACLFTAAHFVAGIWLGCQQHASLGRRALWFLFGFTSGLWAVGIWLFVQLFEHQAAVGS